MTTQQQDDWSRKWTRRLLIALLVLIVMSQFVQFSMSARFADRIYWSELSHGYLRTAYHRGGGLTLAGNGFQIGFGYDRPDGQVAPSEPSFVHTSIASHGFVRWGIDLHFHLRQPEVMRYVRSSKSRYQLKNPQEWPNWIVGFRDSLWPRPKAFESNISTRYRLWMIDFQNDRRRESIFGWPGVDSIGVPAHTTISIIMIVWIRVRAKRRVTGFTPITGD